ncbi:SpoIIE family protein phosphatase [Streptomyces sp. NPDC001292]|uniref:SpoIIE family protein phosphatase n=1 Tax=Streptomyces sp. NPDC001292 TaxID=3364558 RepID=UPI0036AF9933
MTGWSEGAQLLLGYAPEEAVGHAAADLLAADVPEPTALAAGARQPWRGALAVRHRDGHRLAVEVRLQPSLDGAGRTRGYVMSTVPAEEHRRQEDLLLLDRSFTQAPVFLFLYDTELRYRRLNEASGRLMGVTEADGHGRLPDEVVSDPAYLADPMYEEVRAQLRQVAETGVPVRNQSYIRAPREAHERAWSSWLWPVKDPSGRVMGITQMAYDNSEEYWARQRLALLNEASTRIGSTLSIERTAQELADVAVPPLADYASVDLLTFIHRGDEPPSGPLVCPVTMRRTARQSSTGTFPEGMLRPGNTAAYPASSPAAECLATGRSAVYEMTESALARWAAHDPERAARIRLFGAHSVMVVPMCARGVTLGVTLFARSRRPEPFGQDDVLLAEEITARAAVCIDNARRYTRERTTAETLQRSLLPQALPGQAALEVASRYLPAGARAGVGGDWFDVIPLSGARVALVVGDVVGHGVQASATMGRLRTAVLTLADIDLPPEELLTHLDDLVTRTHAEAGPAEGADVAEAAGGLGATCLYAVYDPVSRRCTMARAGHLLPAVVTPGGAAELVDLPAGPPLGLGGLPFEAAELELPEDSLLALYTDGLVEARDRDIDEGLDTLRRALARPAQSLDALCDAVLAALLPDTADDDIALLIARTRALSERQVATWDLPSDPAIVARARTDASDRLAAWGLDEVAFTAELVVSELVTNAIRYGLPPIQLRLIHDRTLICEVSDGSSTSPHLRRAHTFDEGGRGLMLVSQLTQHWGTRHARESKTIWAEMPLTTD